jgi:hypothetical protein
VRIAVARAHFLPDGLHDKIVAKLVVSSGNEILKVSNLVLQQ